MMRAMQLERVGAPLRMVERPLPVPGPGELLIEVAACGICRTDLHIADGELEAPLPIVPGHEIVGRVAGTGERVGVSWLGRTCGPCLYCRRGRENLCDEPLFTGFSRDGGFATHVVADARFCVPIPDAYGDVEAAPLLCAGLIGWRALKLAGEGETLGLYGSAPRQFALSLGCASAQDSGAPPPEQLGAAIIFAPVGALVPEALKHVRKGGRVVCGGIHMSDIPAFPYADLWGERSILSVANLTRADGIEFLELAARAPVRTRTMTFPLERANEALVLLRAGKIEGAAVLVPQGDGQ
jgi:propanol-preferring alcohol dehydrogenase